MSLTTKKALAMSLKSLLEKRTLDKITVKDIVSECSLNRQTFYYHFHDTYDLLQWRYSYETGDIIEKMRDPSVDTDDYGLILQYILNNRNFIINTCRSLKREYLIIRLKECIQPIILEIIKNNISDTSVSSDDADAISDLFSNAFIGLILDWVSTDLSEDYLPKFRKYADLLLDYMAFIRAGCPSRPNA